MISKPMLFYADLKIARNILRDNEWIRNNEKYFITSMTAELAAHT